MKIGFLFAVVYAFVVTMLYARQQSKPAIFSRHQVASQAKPSWVENLICWFFTFIVASLFFPFCALLFDMAADLITLPHYKAKVVAVQSYQDECETKDSRGRTESYACTKHLPVVRFQDDNNLPVEVVTDVASGAEPEIGASITVAYQTGMQRAVEVSLRKILLMIGLAFMMCLLGALLTHVFLYLYRNRARAAK